MQYILATLSCIPLNNVETIQAVVGTANQNVRSATAIALNKWKISGANA